MQRLFCTACGAALTWDGVSPVVTCQFCGSCFQMQGSAAKSTVDWRTAAMRGGCVADRPVLEGADAGKVYYRTWMPEGWSYNIFIPDVSLYGMTLLTPFVPGIHMTSPDGSAFISHIATNGYQENPLDRGLERMAGGLLGILGKQASTPNAGRFDKSTYSRIRALISAVDYCDEVADRTGLQIDGVLKDDEPDDFVAARIAELHAKASPQVQQSLKHEWARCTYAAQRGGAPYAVVVETQITVRETNSVQAFAPIPRFWYTEYELVMACSISQLDALMPEFERVRRSIALAEDYYTTKQEISACIERGVQSAQAAQQSVNNAIAQMGEQNAAHFDRISQINQSTHNDIMDTMHAMNANTAATSDRIARWQSETIRGVNAYAGFGGQPMEADIRFDHVYGYQPDAYPNTDAYLGVEGEWFDPGADFTELPRV